MASCEPETGRTEHDAALPTLVVVGVNHRDTPISLRERLTIQPADLPEILASVRAIEGVDEAAALSTCNRVEIYTALS